MVIVLFCRRQNKFYSQAFVLIALQLIISHFLGFIPQLVVVIPEILQTKNNLFVNQTTWINNTFSTFGTFPIYGILHFSFLMALNRFVVFILPKYNAFFKIRGVWALIMPNIMFIMYIAIFYSIRRRKRSTADINRNQKKKKILAGHGANAVKTYDYERALLIQAAIYCGMMEVGVLSFSILPTLLIKIFGGRIAIPLGIIRNCYGIITCAKLPTIYFIYSKEARNTVKEYFAHFLHLRTALSKTKVVIISSGTNTVQ
uniref:G protein-coupled receptor n=1 Tax=Onchocerca volvulus TaxID=6282 RepID=A0A8R1XVU6_ONCVO